MGTVTTLIRTGVRGATGPAGPPGDVNHICMVDDSQPAFVTGFTGSVVILSIPGFTAGAGNLIEVNLYGHLGLSGNDGKVFFQPANGEFRGVAAVGAGAASDTAPVSSGVGAEGINFTQDARLMVAGHLVPSDPTQPTTLDLRFVINGFQFGDSTNLTWARLGYTLRAVPGTYTGA